MLLQARIIRRGIVGDNHSDVRETTVDPIQWFYETVWVVYTAFEKSNAAYSNIWGRGSTRRFPSRKW
jgi:hypothetical protein